MSYYDRYPKQETAAAQKARAARALIRLRKKQPDLAPVFIEGRALAKNWWGKAWHQNLESYADYENRIARGKSYVRNNAVLDLTIHKGIIQGVVLGSGTKLYDVRVHISALRRDKWEQIIEMCNHRIGSLEQLVQGKFPEELEDILTDMKYGLFPSPKEIRFMCSCPDMASMCKHVAAVLYGTGARFDQDPMLFFSLRDVDGQELVKQTMLRKRDSMLKNADTKSRRVIEDDKVPGIFGL